MDGLNTTSGKQPDAELLERMADANDAAAEMLEQPFGTYPEVVAHLRIIAIAQRQLAKLTREGKRIKERCSTDG